MTAEELTLPADGRVRLVLARHGQTPSNVRHRLDTLPPGPSLTDEGHRQAHALADQLAAEPILAVHASRTVRARETARPLASRRGLPVNVVDGMQEIYVGELEGSGDPESRQRFEDIYARWHAGRIDEPMPGGETGRQALTRFLGAARQVVDPTAEGTIVLVSHGAMLRFVAGHLAVNLEPGRANSAYLSNAGTIVLDNNNGAWHCASWDNNPIT